MFVFIFALKFASVKAGTKAHWFSGPFAVCFPKPLKTLAYTDWFAAQLPGACFKALKDFANETRSQAPWNEPEYFAPKFIG